MWVTLISPGTLSCNQAQKRGYRPIGNWEGLQAPPPDIEVKFLGGKNLIDKLHLGVMAIGLNTE
jgi:hypothetical protein